MDYFRFSAISNNKAQFNALLLNASYNEIYDFIIESSISDINEYYPIKAYFSLPNDIRNKIDLERIVIYAMNHEKTFEDVKDYILLFLDEGNIPIISKIFVKYGTPEDVVEFIESNIEYDLTKFIDEIEKNYEENKELSSNISKLDIIKSKISDSFVNKLIAERNDNLQTILDFLSYERFSSGRIKNTIKKYPRALMLDSSEINPKNILSNIYNIDSKNNILVPDGYIGVIETSREDIYIPVIRYEVLGGFYYSGGEEYCGTFYYYEPESSYFLKSTKTLISPNKFLAYLHLIGGFQDIIIEQFFDLFPSSWKENPYEQMLLNDNFDFKISRPEIYGYEDIFDQEICKLAFEKNYDTVLFSTMQGSQRIISEILDVRERPISELNIFKLNI